MILFCFIILSCVEFYRVSLSLLYSYTIMLVLYATTSGSRARALVAVLFLFSRIFLFGRWFLFVVFVDFLVV
jgi:hypothetical protein